MFKLSKVFICLFLLLDAKSDFVFNCKKNRWESIRSCKRSYCNAVTVQDVLYIIGGRGDNGEPLQDVIRLNGNSWETLSKKLLTVRSESGKKVKIVLGS